MDLSQLNCDISFNILSRLPANILYRLIIVSKGWQRLITDPDFIQTQKSKTVPVSLSGFFFQERFEYCDVDVDNLSYIPIQTNDTKIYQNVLAFLPEKVVILASSNGLLCCRSCIPSSNPTIYICNPVNKEWTPVKWEKTIKGSDHIAFGFDPSSNCYKLVKVAEVDDLTSENKELYFTFEIHNLRSEKWVKSKEVCYCEESLCTSKRLFSKGILYWLTESRQMMSFDIENDLSLLVSPPLPFTDGPCGYCSEICLGESNDKLHCIMVSDESILVWALVDRFSSTWDLVASIPLLRIETANPQYFCALVKNVGRTMYEKDPWVHPLAFKDSILFLRVSNSAYTIDIRSKKLRWVCNMPDLCPNSYVRPLVIPYSMSLESVANHIHS